MEPSGALGNLSLLPGCCLKQQTWQNVDPKMTGCQLINFLKLISTHTQDAPLSAVGNAEVIHHVFDELVHLHLC